MKTNICISTLFTCFYWVFFSPLFCYLMQVLRSHHRNLMKYQRRKNCSCCCFFLLENNDNCPVLQISLRNLCHLFFFQKSFQYYYYFFGSKKSLLSFSWLQYLLYEIFECPHTLWIPPCLKESRFNRIGIDFDTFSFDLRATTNSSDSIRTNTPIISWTKNEYSQYSFLKDSHV